MSIAIGVRAIAAVGDRILLCQNRANKEVFWCLPGGGLEEDESLRGGLQRELKEEFGIDTSVGRLLVVHESLVANIQHIQFFFHIALGEEFKGVNPDTASHAHEISNFTFMPVDRIPDSTIRPDFLKQLVSVLYASGYAAPIVHIEDQQMTR